MKTHINDSFWQRYIQLIRTEMIPYQWRVLNDEAGIAIDKERDDDNIPSDKSNAIENLKIAAGQKEGHHYGYLFQDTDVYKWLESAANTYAIKPDEKLKSMMDDVAVLIEEAQEDDGYISTYYQIDAPEQKFRRLFESHELYSAGHLIEASVAYYKATGEDRLISVSKKLVVCIQNAFGPEEGKIHGADGHQEIELALVRLYEVTGDQSYLDLSEWFLEIRGQDPDFYQKQLDENKKMGIRHEKTWGIDPVYLQAHKPVPEQEEAVGHAVRLVYMATAMAEVAYHNKNQKLLKAAKSLWKSIVTKRLYITGGIGSTVHGEAFTFDYDLPNDTMYCETCASIGLMFFARAMMKNEVDAEYADIMERALYNTVISGMALDGKHFFYVNPLEVDPKSSKRDPGKSHVKPTRPSWFGCACCPPNLARTLTSLDRYIASTTTDSLSVHLYMGMEGTYELEDQMIKLKQTTQMPYEGEVTLEIKEVVHPFTLRLRIPSWAEDFKLKVNDIPIEIERSDGYAMIEITSDATLSLTFAMPVLEWQSHPLVKEDKGKVAVQRGPFVYCIEEEDNEALLHLYTLADKPEPKFSEYERLGDFVALEGTAEKILIDDSWSGVLYKAGIKKQRTEMKKLTFIPYHLWANRSTGEMRVWVDRKQGKDV
ncbi:hypothetical protein SAMN04488100_10438 [Alkalibacterium putridalgicola]|uniref:Glycoside hydrolase family 127 protein n=1 Tax=Alkalibacterium putridalgicola TaxID=426703 RepID=A0A1H7RBR6_9LACT|nr:beta-L-arabinofuranosidase domain-containing protein [Alkalibacterium putridalgicola]GEK88823.1 hypothetical protein APU01nite_08620 [Alkalibacterium putridalgicola]SEL57643.1 hypothetical protein SAMN04488100_10438 [Alkalibacterium putridalgicola]